MKLKKVQRQKMMSVGYRVKIAVGMSLVSVFVAFACGQAAEGEELNPGSEAKKTAQILMRIADLDVHGVPRGIQKQRETIAGLYRQGQDVAMLKTFRDFFMDRIARRDLKTDRYVVALQTASSHNKKDKIMEGADALLEGKLKVKGDALDIGTPGNVDWEVDRLSAPTAFYPLLDAYLLTGQKRYFATFLDYLRGWEQHQDYMKGVNPFNSPDEVFRMHKSAKHVLYFLGYMHALARFSPEGGREFPADVLVRVMAKLQDYYLAPSIAYAHACPQNWNYGKGQLFIRIGLGLEDFKVGDFCFNEGVRVLETYEVEQFMPDGTENQRDPWYNRHGVGMLADGMEWLYPEHKDDVWWDRMDDSLQNRIDFILRHVTPKQEMPILARTDKRQHLGYIRKLIVNPMPEALNRAENARIYHTLSGNSDWGVPHVLSDCFPYGGYYYMREGWNPDDSYLFMYCISQPGKNWGGSSANNQIGLSAFGEDLLVTERPNGYTRNNPPLEVDGQWQFFLAGIPIWAHRGPMTAGPEKVNPWRWHTSETIDLIEGLYRGPFVNPDHRGPLCEGKKLPERVAQAVDGIRAAVNDVRHRRQILYVRPAGLWIVTDRIVADKPHDYALVWTLPLQPSRYPSFMPDDLSVDQQPIPFLNTTSSKRSNVSIHHFGPERLALDLEVSPLDEKARKLMAEGKSRRGKIYDLGYVRARWRGQENNLVVSVIHPRSKDNPTPALEFNACNASDRIRGFTTKTLDGLKIAYLAAGNNNGKLRHGDVTAEAECLLLTEQGGAIDGLVLGCHALTVDGNDIALPSPDCQFRLESGKLSKAQPVRRPMNTPTIEPADVGAFTDTLTVRMSCGANDAELRYTMDGSIPDLNSPLYDGPFEINRSRLIKARCFRKGVTTMPVDKSATTVSYVARAYFEKKVLQQAVSPGDVESGLTCAYREDEWQRLYLFADELEPCSTKTVPNVFDQSQRETKGPCSFQYSGYLRVPADGVYTFHAPHELVSQTIEAGYRLDLRLGGEPKTTPGAARKWWPRTRRHAFGTWSVALQKGLHPFQVTFTDYRTPHATSFNHPALKQSFVWDGQTPNLLVSGPGMKPQPIPRSWLSYRQKVENN